MEYIAGIDEVGRGSLAGPVLASSVILKRKYEDLGLKDSKKLTKKKRESLFRLINKKSKGIGIGIVSPAKIDKINIREATFLAMNLSLDNLSLLPVKALVDGFPLKNKLIPSEGIISGDSKVDSIMAASIIAKVTRDNIMNNYSKLFPEYGFETNNGYGTKFHIEALKQHKSTPIHRKTFSPVKKYMPTISWLKANKRILWISEKFAGLHLMEKGHKIIKLLKNFPYANLITEKEGKRYFVKVYNSNDKSTRFSNKKFDAREFNSIIKRDISKKDEFQLCLIDVEIKRNRSPRCNFIYFDHLK